MKKVILVCISSLMYLIGFSQLTYDLDSVIVSADRIPLKISETGRSITVIQPEEIKSLPATSIDEILQNVAGLEVQSRFGFGVQGDILLRGSTFTQVLMLIDGMKVNDPLTGHFNGNLPVTPGEIERIEVLRGASAALYGADAVGGVINIITKAFGSRQSSRVDISGTLNYGANNLLSGNLGYAFNNERLSLSGGISTNKSDGQLIPAQTVNGSDLEEYNTYFDVKTVGLGAAYKLDNGWTLKGRSSYNYNDFNARYFYTASTFDKSTETVTNWFNHIQLLKIGSSGATDFNIAHRSGTDEFVFSPDFPSTNNHDTKYLNITVNHMLEVNPNYSLKFGAQYDKRDIASNDRGDHNDTHFGAYAMGVHRKGAMNLTLSVRGDYDENYDFEISPQVNLSYILPKVVLRASAGRSVRAADYTERYVSNNLENLTPGRSLGNPNLIAESSWSQEVGLDYSVRSNWLLKATLFSRQSDNLIDYVSTNATEIGSVSSIGSLRDGADYFFAKNISDINTNGIELESRMSQNVGDNANVSWNLGYTYINNSNEEASVYISNHAKHLLNTSLIYRQGKIELALSGLYKERNGRVASAIASELTDSYSIWNVRAGVWITDQIGINLQINNIADTEYQNILGARMPGRWLLGGVKWNLNK